MIVGIKVNSYEYDSECVSSIIHEDISEVHLFYESIEYKNTLVSIIEKNVIDMNIRVYIHINNIDDINLDDVLLFNRHEFNYPMEYPYFTYRISLCIPNGDRWDVYHIRKNEFVNSTYNRERY